MTQKTISRVKTDYEKEVMNLRSLVDDAAKVKHKLENDYATLRHDVNDVKTKLGKKSKDFIASQKSLTYVENSLAELQANLSKVSSERDKLLAERKVS